MKLPKEVYQLLLAIQSWKGGFNHDKQVAALQEFATTAENLLLEPVEVVQTITVDYPKDDHGTRKLVCMAINEVLKARGIRYQTTGRHFTVMPEAKPAGQIGITEAVKAWESPDNRKIFIGTPGSHRFLTFSGPGRFYFQNHSAAHTTPEAAIREQLAAGVKVFSGDLEIVDTGCLSAGLTVPLGPNRTRDGHDARVICNDLKNPRFPVAYVRLNADGEEFEEARFVSATGSYLNLDTKPHPFDLVGHLPPEPVKPREIWYRPTASAFGEHISIEKPADAGERGYKLFREVTEP